MRKIIITLVILALLGSVIGTGLVIVFEGQNTAETTIAETPIQ